VTGYPLSPIQQAYNGIREHAEKALNPYPADEDSTRAQVGYVAGLQAALDILKEIDPDADPGPVLPGRCY
jgi:hypothetical protein